MGNTVLFSARSVCDPFRGIPEDLDIAVREEDRHFLLREIDSVFQLALPHLWLVLINFLGTNAAENRREHIKWLAQGLSLYLEGDGRSRALGLSLLGMGRPEKKLREIATASLVQLRGMLADGDIKGTAPGLNVLTLLNLTKMLEVLHEIDALCPPVLKEGAADEFANFVEMAKEEGCAEAATLLDALEKKAETQSEQDQGAQPAEFSDRDRRILADRINANIRKRSTRRTIVVWSIFIIAILAVLYWLI